MCSHERVANEAVRGGARWRRRAAARGRGAHRVGMPPLKNMLKISSGSKSSKPPPPPPGYARGAPIVRSTPSRSYAALFCGSLRHENARDTAARARGRAAACVGLLRETPGAAPGALTIQRRSSCAQGSLQLQANNAACSCEWECSQVRPGWLPRQRNCKADAALRTLEGFVGAPHSALVRVEFERELPVCSATTAPYLGEPCRVQPASLGSEEAR